MTDKPPKPECWAPHRPSSRPTHGTPDPEGHKACMPQLQGPAAKKTVLFGYVGLDLAWIGGCRNSSPPAKIFQPPGNENLKDLRPPGPTADGQVPSVVLIFRTAVGASGPQIREVN